MTEKGYQEAGKLSGVDRRAMRRQQRQTRHKESYAESFPSGKYKSASEMMSTEDDTDFLNMEIRHINDPQYYVDGILDAIEKGHKVGHWDERVAAQETAFDNYCQALLKILMNFTPMNVIHDFCISFPTTGSATTLTLGDGQTGNVTVPLFTKDRMSQYYTDIKNIGAVVPKCISKLIKTLMSTVWELNTEWYAGGITVPGRYLYSFVPYYGTTDLDTIIATLKTNLSKAEKFMNFFGIPAEPFNESLFEYDVKPLNPNDDLVIAWFGRLPFAVYHDAANNVKNASGVSWQAAVTSHKLWYKHGGSPNDHIFHKYVPLFYGRHATYNPYGGLISTVAPATDGYTSLLRCDEDEDTELICGSTMGAPGIMDIIMRYDALYRSTDTMNLSLTGTKVVEADLAINMYAASNNWKYYTGLDHIYYKGVLVRELVESIGFVSKSKDAPAFTKR